MIELLEFALTTEVDATEWAGGEDLYERTTGSGDQTITSASTESYNSPIALLCGFGMLSGLSLSDQIATHHTGAGAWSVYIEPETDKLRIEYTGGAFTLEVVGTDGEAFGYGADGAILASVAIPSGGGAHRIEAPHRAKPGNITNAHLTLDPNDGLAFTVPHGPYRAQSVWVLMRSASGGGSPDADQNNAADTIAYRDALVIDSTDHQSYMGITDDGRTWMAWPSDLSVSQPYWLSETFREMLGFRGDEVPETVAGAMGDLEVFESSNFNAWAVATGWPVRSVPILGAGEDTQAHRLVDRTIVSSTLGRWQTVRLAFWIGGQTHTRDLHRHYLNWLALAAKGKRIDAYLRWGDTRRAQGVEGAVYSGALDDWTREPYSTLWTIMTNGMGGRLILRRSPDDDATTEVDLLRVPMKRARVSLLCEVAEDDA